MSKRMWLFLLGAILVSVGIIAWRLTQPAWTFYDKTEIVINGHDLTVYLADSNVERARGLSWTDRDTLGADGMLFVFPTSTVQTFWMHAMNYPLDVVWIDGDTIMKIDHNVPVLDEQGAIGRMSSDPFSVDKVLELPAGQAGQLGLETGMNFKQK